jgi:uncharacterized RDD family membrane protein YckC
MIQFFLLAVLLMLAVSVGLSYVRMRSGRMAIEAARQRLGDVLFGVFLVSAGLLLAYPSLRQGVQFLTRHWSL